MQSFHPKTRTRSSIQILSERRCLRLVVLILVCVSSAVSAPAQSACVRVGCLQQERDVRGATRALTLAILDFGDSAFAHKASETLAASLKRETARLKILDRDQVRAAARGVGYAGSINLSLEEARELGAALGADFFILGDAQTLRRSPSDGPVYFESYASVFLVSARTGRLIRWERPNFKASTEVFAEQALLNDLSTGDAQPAYATSVHRAHEDERGERRLITAEEVLVIEAAPDDDKIAAAEGLRLPRPYRRLVPPYPETAAKAEAEAIVDVLVDLDAGGEVTHVEVARWAGFGLDQATLETVRRLHFFPAMRNGVAIPIRVLLRYNFRKPPAKEGEGVKGNG